MYQYIFIIGNNPSLSLAEIKAKFNDPHISILSNNAVMLKLKEEIKDPQETLDRMGGTIKIANYELRITNSIYESLFDFFNTNFIGKRHIGISFYDKKKNIYKDIFELKKNLKKEGISKRFILDRKKMILGAATLKKNKLLSKGIELVIVPDKNGYAIGKTIAYQNIDEYSKRDYGKPKPDPHSGMLPPKLSQIMISLAQVNSQDTIYDPFCGSGTILQEALLQNINIIGSDISEKATIHTQENLKWLIKNFNINLRNYRKYVQKNVFVADAAMYKLENKVNAIVTEPFLGPALRNKPAKDQAKQFIKNLLPLYQKFLLTSLDNLKENGKIVMVLPRYQTTSGDLEFPINTLLDQKLLSYYNQIRFDDHELIYQQPRQKVHRQIIVLQKR